MWENVCHKGQLDKLKFTHWKNKIGVHFDKNFDCIILLRSPRVGKKVITIQAYCKHKSCRKYKLVGDTTAMLRGICPSFIVYYSKHEIVHDNVLVRQQRGILRDETKEKLRKCYPATYIRDLVDNLDESDYENKKKSTVPKDNVVQKIRSEALLSQDHAREDFEDVVGLQNATKYSPYIQKVISPFAVYVHSVEQLQTLVLFHKRKIAGTEVVGRLDATGGVVHVIPETSTHPVLYYPLVIAIKMDDGDEHHVLFPVTESLNSAHGVPAIGDWLFNFREAFMAFNPYINPIFDRIITDFSFANLHGVLHAFQAMRLQEYLFLCYKYCVGLEDYSKLRKVVKLQMCKTHFSKTMSAFCRSFYPSDIKTKKSTVEQSYVTEVLLSLVICKSYNLMKEIFRNLCIILCEECECKKVEIAKGNIAKLTEHDLLITPQENFRENYKYNTIDQEKLNEMSEDETVYDHKESILKLPIYKGSPFYADLHYIVDDTKSSDDEDNSGDEEKINVESVTNSLFKPRLIDDFMKQFGGMLPLWTGLTVPEGVESYDNQFAERQMKVGKDVLDEEALNIGYHKLRPTRFLKLLRRVILSHAKRYSLRIPKGRMTNSRNSTKNKKAKQPSRRVVRGRIQKGKDKDDCKMIKKIVTQQKRRNQRSSYKRIVESSTETVESLNPAEHSDTTERNVSLDAEVSDSTSKSVNTSTESISQTIGGAKEGWSKSNNCRFSYNQRKTILSSIRSPAPKKSAQSKNAQKKRKAPPPKASHKNSVNFQTSRETVTRQVSNSIKSTSMKSKHPNQLYCDVDYYLQLLPFYFNVGRIGDCRLMSFDFNTLKLGISLSKTTMDYIMRFILPNTCVNVVAFANSILDEKPVNLPFKITNKVCVMPFLLNDMPWECYVVDCKLNTMSRIGIFEHETVDFKHKLEFFIKFYNDDKKHTTKLPPIHQWNELPSNINTTASADDAGIFVIHYIYAMLCNEKVNIKNFEPKILRTALMADIIRYSDNVMSVCGRCGHIDDSLSSDKVNWTKCGICDRWYHDACINETDSDIFECKLCTEDKFNRDLLDLAYQKV